MQLSVREIAQVFGVSERQISRWIEREGLPAYRIYDQYRCNRAELVEWAFEHSRPVPPQLLHETAEAPLSLAEALQAGGVFAKLHAPDKQSAWRALLAQLPLPVETDFMLAVLTSQESLHPMASRDGIVSPHVGTPLVLNVATPMLALGLFQSPVVWGEGQRVYALFLAICRTLSEHWTLLARLSLALRDAQFAAAIKAHSPRDCLIREAQRLDKLFEEMARRRTP